MKKDDYSYCQVIGITDRGLKRAANEDWLGERKTPNGWVAVVCDGMGGHVGGATASHIAVETILDFLSSEYFEDARIAIGKAIDKANSAIQQKATLEPELQGMGSTCVLLIVRDGKVYIGHVGDSRIYLIRDHRIHQLTKDHSYVQMLVDMGEITAEQAEHHPRKNEITNALGIPQMQPATVMQNPIEPQAGDCFLLCSDGLSGMVESKTIEHIVSQQMQLSAQDRAAKLVEKAKEGGGLDNITVQLVEFGATPAATSKETGGAAGKWWLWVLLSVIVCAIVVALYFLLGNKNKEDVNIPTDIVYPSESKEEVHINLGRALIVKSDTVLLLTVNNISDTSTLILKDANNGYLESIDNVIWRNPTYQSGKITVNYDAMPINGKYNGVVRVINEDEKAFFIKFESIDHVYTIEVDVERQQPKVVAQPIAPPRRNKESGPLGKRSSHPQDKGDVKADTVEINADTLTKQIPKLENTIDSIAKDTNSLKS